MKDKGLNGKPVFKSELGFFSNPVYFGDNQVLKRYNLSANRTRAEEYVSIHELFIKSLRDIKINVPETFANVVPSKDGRHSIEIVQDRFEPEELAGEIIMQGSREEAVESTVKIVDDAITFLNSPLLGAIGFHPTVRNYAFRKEAGFYIDTFPPYTDRGGTKRMMIEAAPSYGARLTMGILYPFLEDFVDEYYNPVRMVSGIVRTSGNLRPDCKDEIHSEVRNILKKRVSDYWKDEVLDACEFSRSRKFLWKVARTFYRKPDNLRV